MNSIVKTIRQHWLLPAAIALVAFCAVVASIDPAGSYPQSFAGPGLTIDEVFNVEQGTYLIEGLHAFGWGAVHPASWRDIVSQPVYLPDHPPAGRLLLGLSHEFFRYLFPPAEQPQPSRFTTAAARPASAFAFALTILLVGGMTSLWFGRVAGVTASLSMLMMPRLFGHAHLAALESSMNLTYAACVLLTAHFWIRMNGTDEQSISPPGWKVATLTGMLWGLALLTKIQAVLIPIPLIVWSLWHWRMRSLIPLLLWGASGLLIFFLGWPWLWLDPWQHLTQYFGQTTQRVSLHVWYLGQQWTDKSVPWHYSFVIFLTTIPLVLHALAGWSCLHQEPSNIARQRKRLLCMSALWPIVLFAVPGVAVYDGERLFLVSYPLWAVLIGYGGNLLWNWLQARMKPRAAVVAFLVLLSTQCCGLFASAPGYLGYYNLLVGGTRGARAIGLETSYWGEEMNRTFFDSVAKVVPEGSKIQIGPIMHPLQIPAWESQIVSLQRRGIRLKAWDPHDPPTRYLILYSRLADLPPLWQSLLEGVEVKPLVSVRQQGVIFAALYEWEVWAD